MKHIYIRPYRPEDRSQLLSWLPEQTTFDLDLLEHSSTIVLVACDENGPLAFLPISHPLMTETIVIRPDESGLGKRARAFEQLMKVAAFKAFKLDAPEICFLSDDQDITRLAETQGFQNITWPLMRVNLRELETPRVLLTT